MQTNDKINEFEQMRSWQKSTDLAVEIYKTTATFPKSETFGLISQLRRAFASISAIIAEGFGCNSNKEKIQFYVVSYGSTLEVNRFVYLCERLNFISHGVRVRLLKKILEIQKMIKVSMKAVRNAKT